MDERSPIWLLRSAPPGGWIPDPSGQRALFSRYWSSSGWNSKGSFDPDAFNLARRAGYAFGDMDAPHDQIVEELLEVRASIAASAVGNAFADSLGTARLDLRSALGSYGASLNLPAHRIGRPLHAMFQKGTRRCAVCWAYDSKTPEDLDILNFERFKWGGVRHAQPSYALLDLSRFKVSRPDAPSTEGRQRLRAILDVASSLPSDARPRDLLKAIKPLIAGNDDQRRAALGCLSYAGVLQPSNQPGFFGGYPVQRQAPPEWKNDWPYPLSWWRGKDGVNLDAFRFYFSDL